MSRTLGPFETRVDKRAPASRHGAGAPGGDGGARVGGQAHLLQLRVRHGAAAQLRGSDALPAQGGGGGGGGIWGEGREGGLQGGLGGLQQGEWWG